MNYLNIQYLGLYKNVYIGFITFLIQIVKIN